LIAAAVSGLYLSLISTLVVLKGADMGIGRIIGGTVAILAVSFLPATAHAQSTLTGVVKDTSGAVMPG
jgi:hypothetical protein